MEKFTCCASAVETVCAVETVSVVAAALTSAVETVGDEEAGAEEFFLEFALLASAVASAVLAL